jgi:copper oxidase (laccase) domain-containing protein
MEWRSAGSVEWLEAAMPGSKAVFTTRSAGSAKVSHAPLAGALGIAPESIVSGRQVHGAELAFHDAAAAECGEVDGHVISRTGIVGLVYTADCLPVALAGPGGVAVLHCGWRGLAAGIVGRGADAVGATHAVIGPGIGACCYEVGEEVLGAFEGLGSGVARDRMLDLPEVARRLSRAAGVDEVESAGLCTRCDRRFFSHRRDGGPGRQAGLAWLEGDRG